MMLLWYCIMLPLWLCWDRFSSLFCDIESLFMCPWTRFSNFFCQYSWGGSEEMTQTLNVILMPKNFVFAVECLKHCAFICFGTLRIMVDYLGWKVHGFIKAVNCLVQCWEGQSSVDDSWRRDVPSSSGQVLFVCMVPVFHSKVTQNILPWC